MNIEIFVFVEVKRSQKLKIEYSISYLTRTNVHDAGGGHWTVWRILQWQNVFGRLYFFCLGDDFCLFRCFLGGRRAVGTG